MSESMADFEKEINESLRPLKEGEVIEGTVSAVADDTAFLDIHYHTQGVVKKSDFSDDPAFSMADVKVGDTVKAVVLSEDDGEGNVALSVKEAAISTAWEKVQQYLEDGTVLTVKIGGIVNKGVIAYVEGLRGFIPASHLEIGYVEDTNPYLGKTVEAKVITADPEKKRLVLSVKEVLFEKRREEKERKINAIKPGSVLTGTVENLMPYGAFVDLGDGISGLVHISQIAQKRIESPGEVLKTGQEVKVKVLKVENGKVSLSIKAAEDVAPAEEKESPAVSYKDEGSATTGLGALLAGIKLQ
ncbi:MAG: S1 RNA-binding domain-containing protein [Eubacterium sp.]|nr:S1 RNA-binding domain-containing protein [Eubacterium sp.]MDD7210521.1 S1 RNA-binding domain-containing protein [Lachnospiraceae bacterium]MDY5496671.1 S1 RNA-binding domain-containing protein [Anaerobutyricum sp.]